MNNALNLIGKFRKFVGPKVWKNFCITAMLGPMWFLIESSFVYILQGFLFSIGLLNKAQTFLPDWYPTSLNGSVVILIGFGFLRSTVHLLRIHFCNQTQVSFNLHQRNMLMNYGLKNAEKISTKEIITLFTDVTTQAGVVVLNLSLVVNLCLSTFLLLLMGTKLAPIEMFLGLSMLMLFLFPLKYMNRKINLTGIGIVKEWENINETLLRGLKNNYFLKVYNKVEDEIQVAGKYLEKYQDHFKIYSWISGFVNAFPLLVGVIVLSVITFASVNFIKTDSMKLLSFFYVFIRLAQASSEASATYSSLKLNMPGLKMLYAWYIKNEQSEKNSKANALLRSVKTIDSQIQNLDINAKNLSFGYEGQPLLFQGLNFQITKGDIFVIKGESGTGKSSLLSILLGLQTPTSGDVHINETSLKNHTLILENIVGYVGPEPFLIQGTLKSNLTYGLKNDSDNNFDDDEITKVLKLFELEELVLSLPKNLLEEVGDIPQFSTGQKQRISFARAMLRQPKLLVLDEATANIDVETEKKILNNIKTQLQDMAVIVVTHKDTFDSIATQKLQLGKNL